MSNLVRLLKKYQNKFLPVLPAHLQHGNAYIFDLSAHSSEFQHIAAHDIEQLITHSQNLMEKNNAVIGIGRYAEDRKIYLERQLFQDPSVRTVHLGIDLSVPAGTPVASPLPATVHSFKNNAQSGDYGPTIILKHQLEDIVFYTLYGHLSKESLDNLSLNQPLAAGSSFAIVGDQYINGHWPPHLHFQIINDIEHYRGDFPGVVNDIQKDIYLQRCPDPNLILQIKGI